MTTRITLFTLFLIGILALLLVSCAGTPRKYLVVDASLVKQGQSKAEIFQFLGPPEATRTNQTSGEEWYYYDVHQHFWQRIPFLGSHLGEKEIECLQIILDSDQVIKVVYYVQYL